MVSQGFVLRGLGPAGYGSFGYVSHFFNRLFEFLDSGTSIGFFAKTSQRPSDSKLKVFYFFYVFAGCSAATLFVMGASTGRLAGIVWPGQAHILIWLGLAYGVFYWLNQVTETLIHANALTVRGELLRIGQQIFGFAAVGIIFLFGVLDVASFFLCEIAVFLFLEAGWLLILRKAGSLTGTIVRLEGEDVKKLAGEFYHYTKPLLIATWSGIGAALLERWLLQRFGGSAEQGDYTLAFQIGAMFSLVTNSLSPLLTREFSAALGQNDIARTRDLFARAVPLMYWIASFFGIFCAFQADSIARILGGASYSSAAQAIRIMGVYPALQAFGNLNAVLFYSSGRTREYGVIETAITVLGIPMTFFLLAPNALWGLNLGAGGYAVKLMLTTFLSNQILFWSNARFLKIRFSPLFMFQFHVLLPLTLAAWVGRMAAEHLTENFVGVFLLSGSAYTAAISLLLLAWPGALGLDKDMVEGLMSIIRRKIGAAVPTATVNAP